MATSRTKGRVIFPSNPKDKLEAAAKMYAKHQADGASSPLNALEDFKWADVGPTVADTLKDHNDAVDFSTQAEKLFRKRDGALVNIDAALRSSAATLKGIFAKNPKKLADWGLIVDDTPPTKKTPKPTT